MTDESAREILEGMLNDVATAGAVSEGDFTGFPDAELSDAERALLQAAAADIDDDVSGFGFDHYLKIDSIAGESSGQVGYTGLEQTLQGRPALAQAFRTFSVKP